MKLKKEIFFTDGVFKKGYLRLSLLILLLFSGFIGQSQVVTIEDVSGNENDGVITLTATLSGGAVFGGFSVDVITTDGTALLSDTDYTAISETLFFSGANGQAVTFDFVPTEDTNIESSETVSISMSNLVSPFLINVDISDEATVTIDNDDFGTVSIIPTDANEEGATSGRFRIELSDTNNTGATITLNYTLSGVAVFGALNDYTVNGATTIVSGTVTFNAIQTARNININPIDDALVEGDEDVILTIDAISGTSFTMVSNISNLSIADNDYEPTLTATDASAKEAPGGNRVGVFEVDLGAVNNTGSDIVVNFAVQGASTTVAGDYAAIGTSVSIPDGDQRGIITITPVDDVLVESSETVILDLANGTGYTVGSPNSATVTILDDDSYTPTLTATDASAKEAPGGNRVGVYTVDLGAVNTTGVPIVVNVARLATSTATAPDYDVLPTNVSIPNNQQVATFTMTPVNDAIVEGSENLILNIVTGVGYVLGAPDIRTATVTILDDDVAGVNVDTVTGTTTEAGGTTDFVFTLTSEPTANVTIPINGYDVTETSGPASVLLTLLNWDTGVTLTITGVDDNSIDGDIVDIINTGNVSSPTDLNYNALNGNDVPQLTVTNLDDDGCGTTPMLSNNAPNTEFCGTILADLNDYTDSAPPSGMVLTWSRSSNPLNAGGRLTQTESEDVTSEGSFFGYFYDAVNDCASDVLEVQLVVNDIPTIDSTTGASNCGPSILLLSATASSGASIKWFDSPTGGTELDAGEEYSTMNLESTTSFYVEAEANGCFSERVEVIATIIPLAFSGTASNATACSLASTQQPLSAIDLDNRLSGTPDVGVWSFVSGPSTLTLDAENVVNFLDQAEGDYIFRYTTTESVAPCTNTFTEVTISVTADCTPDPIDIEVLKTVDNENAIAGENVIFTITANNLSPNKAQNIVIGDLLESGFEYVSNTPSAGTYTIDTGMWLIPELGAMGTASLQIEVTVLSEGVYTNVAELLESFPVDNNPANDISNIVSLIIDIPEGIDLEITKTANSSRPLVGDNVVFTITIKNISEEATVNQIRVSDVISADSGFVYFSHNTISGDYDATTGVWLIPELSKDEEAILEITVTVPNAGTYTNTATIIGSIPTQSDIDEVENNNNASAEVLVSLPTEADCGFVFNQFSPNGDGTNDFFIVKCIEQYPANRLQIYDRYGNLVYDVSGYSNNWDGDGDNGQAPDGTYFYLLDLGNGDEVLKGWIQLIR